MTSKTNKHQPLAIFDTIENLTDLLHNGDRPTQAYIKNAGVRSAAQDYEHALTFLYSYRGSRDTFASYRREVERLLQWCWFVNGSSLVELKRADIEAYVDFCQQPPVNWIATKNRAALY